MVSARLEPGDPVFAPAQPFDSNEIGPEEIRADLRAAYHRGRSDERASRRRHPIFMAVLFLAAACGAALLALAVANGSFSDGGRVADESLSAATAGVEPRLRGAAQRTDQSLHNAGAAAKARATGSSN